MSKATIEVSVPQPLLQNNKNVTVTSNTTTSVIPDEGYDGMRSVSVVTNVPSNNETWTNKRFISNNTYTISNLMNDSTKDGISKDSTVVIDVPVPSITQISNYSITSNGNNQNISIPTGYDAVDSISVNVNVKTRINAVEIPNQYGQNISVSFSNFVFKSSSSVQTLDSKQYLLFTSNFITFYLVWNTTTTSTTYTLDAGYYFTKNKTYNLTANYYYINFYNTSGNINVVKMWFPQSSDNTAMGLLVKSRIEFNTDLFNIVVPI